MRKNKEYPAPFFLIFDNNKNIISKSRFTLNHCKTNYPKCLKIFKKQTIFLPTYFPNFDLVKNYLQKLALKIMQNKLKYLLQQFRS